MDGYLAKSTNADADADADGDVRPHYVQEMLLT